MIPFQEYTINLGLMISFIYLTSLFYKNFLMNTDQELKEVTLVFIASLTAWVSMYFGIHLNESVIFDLRFVPLIIATLYATRRRYIIWVGIGTGLMRLTFGLTSAAMVGFINMILLTLLALIIAHLARAWPYRRKMWTVVLTINSLNTLIIALLGVIPLMEVLPLLMFTIFPVNILLSLLLVWIVKDMIDEHVNKLDLMDKAGKDPLTQLFNRRVFLRYFKKYSSHRDRFPLSLVFIDIDHFKKVNDEHGHIVGDMVLQHISRLIAGNLRNVDIVSRYGGEEFVVLLPHCSEKDARHIMERLRKIIEENGFQKHDITIPITLSIGIATSPGVEPKKLLEAADQAVYLAKENGRNRVECAGA
ncbi:diguanylate cyclase [Rossellomorea aquimaris]|uniref:GGDEF domain-containing protein n=1 Tax=Rossellomorea aquimaris TaxID=189382 RepID=UPI001CD67FDC|nr:diguanylate cyclase [Rossellomorea aquimaris]MCA1055733.1 diguanylate cyclase [Rossellomorea aquimaris]